MPPNQMSPNDLNRCCRIFNGLLCIFTSLATGGPCNKEKNYKAGTIIYKKVTPLERPLTEVSGTLTHNCVRHTILAKFHTV